MADWYVISNDDVILEGSFIDELEKLDTRTVWGAYLHTESKLFTNVPCPWIDGWIYYIPLDVLMDVGPWDSNFLVAGFEDADYCFRAYEKDYVIGKTELPFRHFEAHTRKSVDEYQRKRLWNAHYLVNKHGLTELRELS